MRPRVFALWLDGAEPTLLEQLMDEGRLPSLARLRRRGAYGRLQTIDHSFVEATAAMVTTGCLPEQTGSWNMQRFCPRRYELSGTAYEHRDDPPFFALGKDYRIAAFDVPFTPLHPGVRGIQVTAWGSNSHDMPLASSPPELANEIVMRHGLHPARGGTAYAMLEDPPAIRDLYQRLITGLRTRERATLDLFRKEPWDLFFTALNESDAAGHYLWPHAGCRKSFDACDGGLFLRDLYVEIDAVIGRLAEAIGDHVRIVIFSVEGMRQNSDDLASMVFLPELLLRYSFPGQAAMNFDVRSLTPSPESLAGIHDWVMELWNYRQRSGRLASRLRQWLAPERAVRVERFLGLPPSLFHPLTDNHFLNHQPLRWYRPYWPYMKAFALPTSSHGLVRLNVVGREKQGRVKAKDFARTCAEVTDLLLELREPETGQRAVADVHRIRQTPQDDNTGERAQWADLVVQWHPCLGNRLESPRLGSFGPVPYVRTGTHTRDGFLLAAGPGIQSGTTFPVGHPVDVATTILRLVEAPAAGHLRGRALVEPDGESRETMKPGAAIRQTAA